MPWGQLSVPLLLKFISTLPSMLLCHGAARFLIHLSVLVLVQAACKCFCKVSTIAREQNVCIGLVLVNVHAPKLACLRLAGKLIHLLPGKAHLAKQQQSPMPRTTHNDSDELLLRGRCSRICAPATRHDEGPKDRHHTQNCPRRTQPCTRPASYEPDHQPCCGTVRLWQMALGCRELLS